jgi:hypothetical protein
LSIADMLSDLYNIVKMFLVGQSAGACALLALIVASLLGQILIVAMQNSHRGPRKVAWEVLLVLSLFKAGIDAIRVARGEDQVAGCPFDPLTEMVTCKLVEMVFESIPGAVLQAIFALYTGWTTAALLSILISCLSTAFTATMIAYDLDSNVAKRKNTPDFFGYVELGAVCDPER